MSNNLTGYDLSRNWFDYCFENPDKTDTNQTALYFFIIEHCNRLGWKEKFGLPTTMTMEALSIKSYNTYKKALGKLVEHGFIKLIEKSKNQYSANIIALSKNCKATNKALDKALIKHGTKQVQSNDSIDKQVTINKEQGREEPPTPILNNSREKELLRMFKNVTAGYEDEFLLLQVGMFLNKYPDCVAKQAGGLINSWAARINKAEQEKWKQQSKVEPASIINYQKEKEQRERDRLKQLTA